jgi:hypothetical protein
VNNLADSVHVVQPD